jgi:uncharacterized repeat protein (TIGR01451 family)
MKRLEPLRVWLAMVVIALAAALVGAGPAGASVIIGNTTQPTGSTVQQCTQQELYVQTTDDPAASPFSVPAGGGTITSWQTGLSNAGENPGAPLTFVLLRPGAAADSFTVVGADHETLPNPLPAAGVASFNLDPPIPTLPGDVLGVYSQPLAGPGPATCAFQNGSAPEDDVLLEGTGTPTPSAGQSFTATGHSPHAYVLDVAATLDNDVDAGVSASAGTGTVGQLAQLSASVTNAGPATGPITFTDTVPAGLTIDSAVAGGGICSISGQAVTCSVTGLAPGQSAPVVALVTPTAAGSYAYTATVGVTGVTDPNPANNVSGATLTVAPAAVPTTITLPGTVTTRVVTAAPSCHVPRLTGMTPAIAQQVLRLLDCGVGKTAKASSKKVHKGLVIATNPGAGKTVKAGTAVKLTVSSGPPKKKVRRH